LANALITSTADTVPITFSAANTFGFMRVTPASTHTRAPGNRKTIT
jgi:hypothetical protein